MTQESTKPTVTTEIRIGIGPALLIVLTVVVTFWAGVGFLHHEMSLFREEMASQFAAWREEMSSQFESMRSEMREDHAAMREDIVGVQVGVGRLEVRMDHVEQRLESVGQRLDGIWQGIRSQPLGDAAEIP